MTMRIGLITGEYPPMRGGISTQVHRLAEKFAAAGHLVSVLTSVHGTDTLPGVDLHPVISRWNRASLRTVQQWAQANALAVVNLHYQTAAFGMSPWIHRISHALRNIAPTVTTFHDLRFPYLFPKAGPLRPWIVRHLANTSTGVIATNAEDAAALAQHPRAALIPIGSSISAPATDLHIRQVLPQNVDGPVYAFFGFVNRSKGLETLLHSLHDLHEQGIRAHLVMIGEKLGSSDPTNAAYAAEIDALIADLGLGAFIHWTGYADEAAVGAYLHSADAVVMPFSDGASYRRSSMIAALHVGCALVTTNPAVEVSAFIHEQNMLLVPPNNAPALTDALLRLYNTPALGQTLRAGALDLARVFSWPAITEHYLHFYRQVIEAPA